MVSQKANRTAMRVLVDVGFYALMAVELFVVLVSARIFEEFQWWALTGSVLAFIGFSAYMLKKLRVTLLIIFSVLVLAPAFYMSHYDQIRRGRGEVIQFCDVSTGGADCKFLAGDNGMLLLVVKRVRDGEYHCLGAFPLDGIECEALGIRLFELDILGRVD